MKKIIIGILIFLISGCASLEKDVAQEVVDSHKQQLGRCEIEGFAYEGTDAYLKPQKVLKVLMIHGVGIHYPGYSRRLQENMANNIGLDVISRLPKNITLLDPEHQKTKIGNLQISYWQNKEATKKMLFYELTWSEITTPDRKIIAFDTTEQYSKFRVPFNNMMKKFLDNALPDPLIYEVDKNNLILDSANQSLCWVLGTNWDNIPNNQAKVCEMSLYEGIEHYNNENLLFITHSLGSKILMDALMVDVNQVSEAHPINSEKKAMINRLKDKELTFFMLANQLPILQIGHPLPKVHNQINAYCEKGGSKYSQRIFKDVNIVAFSDPNDILSYAIPQEFADKYIDSRICPRVTNVSVNVAPVISAFGIKIVDPITAHTNYDTNDNVINLITQGTSNFGKKPALDKRCHFIEMKRDNQM